MRRYRDNEKKFQKWAWLACFFFIHTEMDAIFQPIKKSDTYQIKLSELISKFILLGNSNIMVSGWFVGHLIGDWLYLSSIGIALWWIVVRAFSPICNRKSKLCIVKLKKRKYRKRMTSYNPIPRDISKIFRNLKIICSWL